MPWAAPAADAALHGRAKHSAGKTLASPPQAAVFGAGGFGLRLKEDCRSDESCREDLLCVLQCMAGGQNPPGGILGDCLGPGHAGKDLHIAQLSAYLGFLRSSCNAMGTTTRNQVPLLVVVFLIPMC